MGNEQSEMQPSQDLAVKSDKRQNSNRHRASSNHGEHEKTNRNYERNPRYLMQIRDEPQQMLRPIQGYAEKSLVTLEEACEPLQEFISDLSRHVWIAKKNSRFPADGLTPDESAAIHLYTMEWDDSLYIKLNRRLREVDRRSLLPWFLFLKLFLTALFKLPSIRGVVWRGVTDNISDEYKKGDEKVWWGFSSCTRTMNVLENSMYLGDRGQRILFSLEVVHGKDIKNHSFYKKEDEILVLPGICFEVTGNLNSGNGLHIISLKQKRSQITLLEPPFLRRHRPRPPISNEQPRSFQPRSFQPRSSRPRSSRPPSSRPPSPPPPLPRGNIKKIIFNNIPGGQRTKDLMPSGYEGFDWENFVYIEESYAQSNLFGNVWRTVFKYSKYGICNKDGTKSMYIRAPKQGKTFTLVDIDATAIKLASSQWNIAGYRDNIKLYSKDITFSGQGKYTSVELNYADVDEVKFATFNGYPELFIGCINIIN